MNTLHPTTQKKIDKVSTSRHYYFHDRLLITHGLSIPLEGFILRFE